MSELLNIINLIKSHNKLILLVLTILLTATAGAFEILSISVIYYLIKSLLDNKSKLEIIDLINNNLNFDFLPESGTSILVSLVVILSIIKSITLLAATYYQQKIVFNTATNVSSEIFLKYTSQPFEYFDGKGSSYFLRNLIGEINQLIDNGLLPTVTLLSESLLSGLLLIALISINPIAAFIFLTVIAIYWFLNSKITGNFLSKWGQTRQTFEQERIEGIQATFEAIKETLLYALQDMQKSEFKTKTQTVFDLLKKHVYLQQIPKILLELIAFLTIIYVAVWSQSNEGVDIIAFLTVFTGILLKLVPSIHRITNSFNSLKYSKEAVEVIKTGLTLKKFNPCLNSKKESSFKERVRINISQISLAIGNKKIIDNFSEEFIAGEIVAIVGKSGAGKSTLLDLIIGFRRAKVGQITYFINNVKTDINKISVGYVPQAPYIFNNSIVFNITLNGGETNQDLLSRVINITNLKGLIDSQPNGIHQIIGVGGVNLSGGQKQRIAIARALYRCPALLILDEPTSALDRTSSVEIMKHLQDIKEFIGIILVTHSDEVASFADRKIELRGLR